MESASKGNAIVARYHRGLPILYTSACVGIMRWLVAAFEGSMVACTLTLI